VPAPEDLHRRCCRQRPHRRLGAYEQGCRRRPTDLSLA
jgi:hypothetical protein